AHDAIDAEAAVRLDRDFGDLRDEGVERLVDRDAARALFTRLAGRQRCSPAGLVRGKFQHTEMAQMTAEQTLAEGDRILAGCNRELVDQGLGRERRVRRSDRPPPLYRHTHLR